MSNKSPNVALIGAGVLNVNRVQVIQNPPSVLSDKPLYTLTLITSKGNASRQFTLFLDQVLVLDLYNQLVALLLDDDDPAADWLQNHEVMASLVQAAAELSDELAAHEGAYEAMMENADRLADALNKIYTEKDDEDI